MECSALPEDRYFRLFPHQGLGMKPTKFLRKLDSPIEKVPGWPPQKEPSRLHRSFVVSLTTNEAVPT